MIATFKLAARLHIMDSALEQVEPRRKRRFWMPVAIILLIFAAMASFAVYKGLQPRYGFLRGIEPVYQGDPYKEMAAAAPASTGSMPKMPSMYMEIYSVQGSFADWERKIDVDMRASGATKQPSYEEVMKNELASMPAAQRKQMEKAYREMPKTASWELEKTQAEDVVMFSVGSGIQLMDGYRFRKGQSLMAASAMTGKEKGWISILIFETKEPTFFSKIGDWFKSVFKRP